MGADTTAIKKRGKKFNEHDNHSRKTPVWKRRQVLSWNLWAFCPSNEHDNHSRKTHTGKWRQVVKSLLDTYGPMDHDDTDIAYAGWTPRTCHTEVY